MEDILNPARMDYEARDVAVLAGLDGRIVSRQVRDDDLLAADLRRTAEEAYRSPVSVEAAASVALATLAWDDSITPCASSFQWRSGCRPCLCPF